MSVISMVVRIRSPTGCLPNPRQPPQMNDTAGSSPTPTGRAPAGCRKRRPGRWPSRCRRPFGSWRARHPDPDVVELAALGSRDGLHLLRPAPARLLHQPADHQVADPDVGGRPSGRSAFRPGFRGSWSVASPIACRTSVPLRSWPSVARLPRKSVDQRQQIGIDLLHVHRHAVAVNHSPTFATSRCSRSHASVLVVNSTACGRSISTSRPSHQSRL